MSRRVRAKIFATALSVLVLPLLGLIATAQATVILYDFNGTGTGGPTVHASMGLNAASTTSNHMLTLADVTSFAVQITTGSFTASGSALPGSLSGQMSNGLSPVFFSLDVNDSLTTFVPSFNGTNNFQFHSSNGQSWVMSTAGFAPIGTQFITGTGTWSVAMVPVPAAVWLFGSGLVGVIGLARRRMHA